jgi:hypothetical protein
MPNASDAHDGALITCLERMGVLLAEAITLARASQGGGNPKPRRARTITTTGDARQVDFSSDIRAFVKRYAKGMSGPQKFTLVVAHLTKGDSSKRILLEELEQRWNKMTAKGLLGVKFNPAYSARARENDWVATEKSGSYYVRPSWRAIFRDDG